MASYKTIEYTDVEEFQEELNKECRLGVYRVVSSNVHYNPKAQSTVYFALLEMQGPGDLLYDINQELQYLSSKSD